MQMTLCSLGGKHEQRAICYGNAFEEIRNDDVKSRCTHFASEMTNCEGHPRSCGRDATRTLHPTLKSWVKQLTSFMSRTRAGDQLELPWLLLGDKLQESPLAPFGMIPLRSLTSHKYHSR